MLVDDVTIKIKGGDGGKGVVSFRQNEGNPRGGPDGGNGGNGGDVYFIGTSDLTALQVFQFKKFLKADDGIQGKHKNLYGKNAEDLYIKVPVGTRITDIHHNRVTEINEIGQKVLLAHGGIGGRGNNEFKSATNQTPRFAEPGTPGQEKEVRLELRIIADIGLIGLPNAGKSSLLEALTNARPKVAAYPFTTLEPNLGMLGPIILADIPGLIEGASGGKGLGIKFLKHIEKTKLLVHCIDVASEDVVADYHLVRNEFKNYNEELLQKKELILLTKNDLVDKKVVTEKMKLLKKLNKNIYTVSVLDDESMNSLIKVFEKETLSEEIKETQEPDVS